MKDFGFREGHTNLILRSALISDVNRTDGSYQQCALSDGVGGKVLNCAAEGVPRTLLKSVSQFFVLNFSCLRAQFQSFCLGYHSGVYQRKVSEEGLEE